MHSLLSVHLFLPRDIRSFRPISLVYQSSFHFLPFKITNKHSRRYVVSIVSIKDAHSRFAACFIQACFWYFENITLELSPTLNIYPFSSIFRYPHPEFHIPLLLTGINRTTAVLFQDPLLDNSLYLVYGYILIRKTGWLSKNPEFQLTLCFL